MFFIEILKAILFGIVEGITEWLPVSSTGHIILLDEFVFLMGSEEFKSMFDVVIQLGAIIAVIVLFFQKLNPFDRGKNEKQKLMTWSLWFKVCVAIVPSGLVGVLFDDWMDAHQTGGNDGHADLEPQAPGHHFLLFILILGKRIEFMEEQHDDCQDGTQLDHHIEHGLEFLAAAQENELVQQDDVTGRGDRQPFGDAFHNAEEDRFQDFDNNFKHKVGSFQL